MGRSCIMMVAACVVLAWTGVAKAEVTRVVVMPAEFTYFQMSAGGVVDALPDDTRAAREHLHAVMKRRFDRSARWESVELPELTPAEQLVLDEHLVLFDIVSSEAVGMMQVNGWRHKRNAFDYTLGPGLAFLADRTGADKAFFISGNAVSASGGRVAMAVLAAAAVGAAIDTGGALLVGAVVDLRSGRIEWMEFNQGFGGAAAPRTEQGAETVLARLMQPYPKSRLVQTLAP